MFVKTLNIMDSLGVLAFLSGAIGSSIGAVGGQFTPSAISITIPYSKLIIAFPESNVIGSGTSSGDPVLVAPGSTADCISNDTIAYTISFKSTGKTLEIYGHGGNGVGRYSIVYLPY